MYVPSSFERTDPAELFAFMEAHSFALLVSTHAGVPFATHLPLLLDRTAGPHGALIGHMARANPQWRDLDGQPVLAIFSGPHAYISPAWYESEGVVPTWNYVAVHATGTARVVDDPAEVTNIVAALVAVYEGNRANPWQFDPSTEYARKMVHAIVGFRLEIEQLEGKWKLNQNHTPERRARVIAALESSTSADEREIARLMREPTPSGESRPIPRRLGIGSPPPPEPKA
jgi:transcriptional regulator